MLSLDRRDRNEVTRSWLQMLVFSHTRRRCWVHSIAFPYAVRMDSRKMRVHIKYSNLLHQPTATMISRVQFILLLESIGYVGKIMALEVLGETDIFLRIIYGHANTHTLSHASEHA